MPSNTALAVGEDIEYAEVITINRYTKEKQTVILARNVIDRWFSPNNENLPFESFDPTKILFHIKFYVLSEV